MLDLSNEKRGGLPPPLPRFGSGHQLVLLIVPDIVQKSVRQFFRTGKARRNTRTEPPSQAGKILSLSKRLDFNRRGSFMGVNHVAAEPRHVNGTILTLVDVTGFVGAQHEFRFAVAADHFRFHFNHSFGFGMGPLGPRFDTDNQLIRFKRHHGVNRKLAVRVNVGMVQKPFYARFGKPCSVSRRLG